MTCTKNPKRFLFLKYSGPHDYKVVKFGRFIDTSTRFIVRYECRLCGCQHDESFVTEEDLLRLGVSIEEIKKHRTIIF